MTTHMHRGHLHVKSPPKTLCLINDTRTCMYVQMPAHVCRGKDAYIDSQKEGIKMYMACWPNDFMHSSIWLQISNPPF